MLESQILMGKSCFGKWSRIMLPMSQRIMLRLEYKDFILIFFYERERGEGEGYNKFPYSLMPIEIWNVGWEE